MVWKKDLRQTIYLKSHGFIVLRFWEKEIKEDVEDCIRTVQYAIIKIQTQFYKSMYRQK